MTMMGARWRRSGGEEERERERTDVVVVEVRRWFGKTRSIGGGEQSGCP